MLADVASRLEKAVETARTSGASDGVTAQLELLHQLSGLLSVAGEEQVKAVQGSIEASCLGAALLGPPPAVAQLCANVLITIYRRGARTTLYTTVGQLLSWLSNKVSPASAPAAKLATVHLLGGLCAAHGGAMVSLCLDSITLLTKLTRSAEPSVRPMAWAAFGRACTGSGGVPRAAQDEAVKNLKHALTERGSTNELRAAALAAAPMLAAYSEGLWALLLPTRGFRSRSASLRTPPPPPRWQISSSRSRSSARALSTTPPLSCGRRPQARSRTSCSPLWRGRRASAPHRPLAGQGAPRGRRASSASR